MHLHSPDPAGGTAADLLLRDEDATPVQLRWRGFGSQADLELRFAGRARNRVVSDVLARCRTDAGPDVAALLQDADRLTLAGRIGGLAAIAARTQTGAAIPLELRCPDTICQEALEISLSLESLLELSRQAEGQRWITVALSDAHSVRVRRPTGKDQRAWQAQSYDSAEQAEQAMLASLLDPAPQSPLPAAVRAAIDDALAQADPLTCFQITTTCPACNQESDHALDLEAVLLTVLQRWQRNLLRDIHKLAERYGWSEGEVAAIPSWRRQMYLDLMSPEVW